MHRDSIVAASAVLVLAGWVGWSYWTDGVIGLLLATDMDASQKVGGLRAFFEDWGLLAPIVYVLIVVVEAVIAPIPGAMLYLPGGMIFGGFWGGTLSLIGNIIGAGLCCTLMRTIVGRSWTAQFFSAGRLQSVQRFIVNHGVLSVAILRVNPLTSSDIVSYAAGLTTLSTTTVMAGTAIGMLPLCYAQAYLSEGLFTLFPWLIWPLALGCVLYAVFAVVAIWRLKIPARESRQTAR